MKMMRQGDLLIKEIDKLPEGLTLKDNILALGEMTNHQHQMVGDCKVMIDNKGNQFIQTEQECQLVHNEHKPITISKGLFQVIRQREYDIKEGTRQVMD